MLKLAQNAVLSICLKLDCAALTTETAYKESHIQRMSAYKKYHGQPQPLIYVWFTRAIKNQLHTEHNLHAKNKLQTD